jgi:hypothetical protein
MAYCISWPQRPAGLVETGFTELAKRWLPILNAFDESGIDLCYEIHPEKIFMTVSVMKCSSKKSITIQEHVCSMIPVILFYNAWITLVISIIIMKGSGCSM